MTEPCPICQKHRGTGPLAAPIVWQDETIVVAHRVDAAAADQFPGHLFVETRRHVDYLDNLSADEAVAVGSAVWRSARALRAELTPEYVFCAVLGTGVAHFHQHVFVRHRGTPEHLTWQESPDWTDAPRTSRADIERLCQRLRGHFD